MNMILKSSILAATLAFGAVPFLSATPAAAGGLSLETGLSILEKSGVMNPLKHRRLNPGHMVMNGPMEPRFHNPGHMVWNGPKEPSFEMPMRDEGPSYGKLEGGLMIVINPHPDGPAIAHGKNNCDHIKRQIAAGEKRLAQMNDRLDQMLADYKVKEVASTKGDVYYTGLSIESLDNQIKDLETALAKLRGKLKKCETAKWF
jgi:hypothetical protein